MTATKRKRKPKPKRKPVDSVVAWWAERLVGVTYGPHACWQRRGPQGRWLEIGSGNSDREARLDGLALWQGRRLPEAAEILILPAGQRPEAFLAAA